jgi:chromatin segregation and condensation protein Rec8/ScpA/Scc1 (kleisin family)
VAFLAMLELRKAGEVSLEQASTFSPIRVLGTRAPKAKEGDESQWIARSA